MPVTFLGHRARGARDHWRTFPFEHIDRAFEMMKSKADGIIKPMIMFG